MADPRLTHPTTESVEQSMVPDTPSSPSIALAFTEIVEPKLPKERNDRDDPMLAKSSTDTDEPKRTKLLSDSDDPRLAKQSTDMAEPM